MTVRRAMLSVALAALVPATAPGAEDGVPCTDRPDLKVGIALDSFRADVGRYPTTAEGLRALRERPAAIAPSAEGRAHGWDGPYLEREGDLRDPRGRRFGYRSPAADGRAYEVWVVEGAE